MHWTRNGSIGNGRLIWDIGTTAFKYIMFSPARLYKIWNTASVICRRKYYSSLNSFFGCCGESSPSSFHNSS